MKCNSDAAKQLIGAEILSRFALMPSHNLAGERDIDDLLIAPSPPLEKLKVEMYFWSCSAAITCPLMHGT